MKKENGFTMMELMLVVAILAILAGVAVPSMSAYMDSRKAVSAAEDIYSQIAYARSEAIARSAKVFVKVTDGPSANWAIGVSTLEGCDPKADIGGTDPCTLMVSEVNVLKHTLGTDHPGVSIATTTSKITFDPVRGGAAGIGTITVTFTGHELRVVVGPIGRVRICSPTKTRNYGACP